MQRVGAATASIVSTVEPVVTVSLAIALFGEGSARRRRSAACSCSAAVVALQARDAPDGR